MLRILIIDNNRTFRQSLRYLFRERFPAMEIETLAGSGDSADLLSRAVAADPDILFADMHCVPGNALDFARALRGRLPDRALVMMCSFDNREYRRFAYGAGADYCLLKDESTFEGIAGLVDYLRLKGAKGLGTGGRRGPGGGK